MVGWQVTSARASGQVRLAIATLMHAAQLQHALEWKLCLRRGHRHGPFRQTWMADYGCRTSHFSTYASESITSRVREINPRAIRISRPESP